MNKEEVILSIEETKDNAQLALEEYVDSVLSKENTGLWTSFKKFKEKGVFAIVGEQIDIKEEKITELGYFQLAQALKIYRDKRFETFRYIIINDEGKITGQLSLCSYLPGYSLVDSPLLDIQKKVLSYALKTNSKIVIAHNHPSGNVEPSKDDIDTTKVIAKNFTSADGECRLLGHIILDHNKYALGKINNNYIDWYIKESSTIEKDPLDKTRVPEFAKKEINSFNSLGEVAALINEYDKWNIKDFTPIIFVNGSKKICGIKQYSNEWIFNNTADVLKKEFKNVASSTGACWAFPLLMENNSYKQELKDKIIEHYKNGCFKDFCFYNGFGKYQTSIHYDIMNKNQNIFDKKTIEEDIRDLNKTKVEATFEQEINPLLFSEVDNKNEEIKNIAANDKIPEFKNEITEQDMIKPSHSFSFDSNTILELIDNKEIYASDEWKNDTDHFINVYLETKKELVNDYYPKAVASEIKITFPSNKDFTESDIQTEISPIFEIDNGRSSTDWQEAYIPLEAIQQLMTFSYYRKDFERCFNAQKEEMQKNKLEAFNPNNSRDNSERPLQSGSQYTLDENKLQAAGIEIDSNYIYSKEFKERFGDWEKANRLEKLKESNDVSLNEALSSNDIDKEEFEILKKEKLTRTLKKLVIATYESKRDKKSQLKVHLSDKNIDANLSVANIKHILSHQLTVPGQIEAALLIQKIANNTIYIGSDVSDGENPNKDIKLYDYFMTGAELDREQYTIKSVVGYNAQGEARYYDQRVSNINKELYINNLSLITNKGEIDTQPSGNYDMRLIYLCQVPQLPYMEFNPQIKKWLPTQKTIELVKSGNLYIEKSGQEYKMKENKETSIGLSEKQIAQNWAIDKLKATGIEVIFDKDEFERILQTKSILQKVVQNKKSLKEQIDDLLEGNLNRYDSIYICNTPKLYLEAGLKQFPMLYSQNHARNALREEYIYENSHGLSKENLLHIPDELESPVMIMDSATKDDSIVVVTSLLNKEDNPIIISVKPNGFGFYDLKKIDSNYITSIYGKNGFKGFVNSAIEENRMLYYNKEKSQALFSVLQVQFPQGLNNLDFNKIIKQSYIFVNNKPSQSMTLSDGTIYGFTHEEKIYLNPDVVNSSTPIHEYTHLWDNYIQNTNTELWNKGKEAFKNTVIWNEVINDPHYEDIKDNEDLVLSECHTRITGKVAEKVLERIAKENGEIKKDEIIDWDKETWKYIAENFSYQDIEKLESVKDFIKTPMKDLMAGKNINLTKKTSIGLSEKQIAQNWAIEKLQAAGIEVISDKDEFDKILESKEILQKSKKGLSDEQIKKYFTFNKDEINRFISEIDRYEETKNNPNKFNLIGNIPPIMQVLGIPKKPIEIENKTITKILRPEPIYPNDKQGHNLSLEDIKLIPNLLANPIMIFNSRTRDDTYVFFTERKDSKNNSIIIPLAVSQRKGRIVINEVTSMYGKDNEIGFVSASLNNLIYTDEKRCLEWEKNKVRVNVRTKTNFWGRGSLKQLTIDNNILTKNRLVNFLASQSMTLSDGTIYGFTHEGKIYLNPDVINSATPIHEYTHLWDNYIQNTNTELWNKGKEAFKNTVIWNEVINDPHYEDIKDNEDLVLSECHARITGKVAEKVLERIARENGEIKKDEIIDWDKETWKYIAENFSYQDIEKFESVKDFIETPMKDLMSGNIEQYLERFNSSKEQDLEKELNQTSSRKAQNWAIEKLQAAGIEVIEDYNEFERVFDDLIFSGELIMDKKNRTGARAAKVINTSSVRLSNPHYYSNLNNINSQVILIQLRKLDNKISNRYELLSAEDFLTELKTLIGASDKHDSVYLRNLINTSDYTLRFSGHNINSANARPNEKTTSLTIKIDKTRFNDSEKNEVIEFVYFKDKLTKERMLGILSGIKNWIKTGEYNFLDCDKINTSLGFKKKNPVPSIKSHIISEGEVYGFTHEGKIYLNPDVINSSTPIHEYTHLWDNYIQNTNTELWNKGKEAFKNTVIWNEVINDPHYEDIKDNEDLVLSECHARITGKVAEKVLERIARENGEIKKDEIIDWDKETWKYIAENFSYQDIEKFESVKDFIKTPMKDLMAGKNINLTKETSMKLKEQSQNKESIPILEIDSIKDEIKQNTLDKFNIIKKDNQVKIFYTTSKSLLEQFDLTKYDNLFLYKNIDKYSSGIMISFDENDIQNTIKVEVSPNIPFDNSEPHFTDWKEVNASKDCINLIFEETNSGYHLDYTFLEKAQNLISDFTFDEYMSTPTFEDLEHIGIAYTTSESEELEINVEVDLKHLQINTYVSPNGIEDYAKVENLVESLEFTTEKEMLDALENLNFEELTSPIYDNELLQKTIGFKPKTEEEQMYLADIQNVIDNNDLDVIITGIKEYNSPDKVNETDKNVLVEYISLSEQVREDDFFEMLHNNDSIAGDIDYNPITPSKSGTIEQYLGRLNSSNIELSAFDKMPTNDLSISQTESLSNENKVLKEQVKLLKDEMKLLKEKMTLLKEENILLEKGSLQTEQKLEKMRTSMNYVCAMTSTRLKNLARDMELCNDKNFGSRMERKLKEAINEKQNKKEVIPKSHKARGGMEY